jgi:hypothetical protein
VKTIGHDIPVGLLILFLNCVLIILIINNPVLLDWVFERHHNQWSWYIRPIFLIPFCFFAYRRSLIGISLTVFALLTSMAWFPKPVQTTESVQLFLQFEKTWLKATWSFQKILLSLAVPFSLSLLALSFWKKNIALGLLLLLGIAVSKIIWSFLNAGNSALSIVVPAFIGFLICALSVVIYFRKHDKPKY